ncbi:MAG: PspA/IM30 family protein [Rhodobacteraceae bacterium]|nr:PspA/IM30 family protein [Paracoccaceae bacterium]
MFNTLNTLFKGANARAEEKLRDKFAIELIDQKIRESLVGLQAAKSTLASLIQRERNEVRQIEALQTRIATLTESTLAALKDDREELATEAANAIAHMENELTVRKDTAARIDSKIIRLRHSVEAANRRIIDLKQSAITAKSIHQERIIQARLSNSIPTRSSIDEAEDLISRIIDQPDLFEQSEILREIDSSLSFEDVGDRLTENGYGTSAKTTASDVLTRLKSINE